MNGRTTITISTEVYNRLVEIKKNYNMPSFDMVLRWLIDMPPFDKTKKSGGVSKGARYKNNTTYNEDSDILTNYWKRVKRAAAYANKIVDEEGYLSAEKLEDIMKKFKVSETDLLKEAGLIMKEQGKYCRI